VVGAGVISLHVGFVLRKRGHDVAQEAALAGRSVDVHIQEHERDLIAIEELEQLHEVPDRSTEAGELGDDHR
jgi:hypothetical protein